MADDDTTAHLEHNQFLIGLLGGQADEPLPEHQEDEPPSDFDGGAREPAPDPESPKQAHNRFVADFARMVGTFGGGP